jgi:high-affinity iron transporter
MFTTALIVFRESLEAALFIGIVAAATRGVAGRTRWLGAGVAIGVLGAFILAMLAGSLSGWLDGLGQDVVNIGVLTLALVMLLWHCVWVTSHAKEMASDAKSLGQGVGSGRRPPWALLAVVGLAVLREGAETVLFVSGSLANGGDVQIAQVLLWGASGLLAGAAVGWGVYAGLASIPARHVFAVTNVMMALLAGSLASQLARAVTQAGFIEAWSEPLWDSTLMLSPDSALGTLLHALLGYDAQPSGAQLLSYLSALAFIYLGTRLLRSNRINH